MGSGSNALHERRLVKALPRAAASPWQRAPSDVLVGDERGKADSTPPNPPSNFSGDGAPEKSKGLEPYYAEWGGPFGREK